MGHIMILRTTAGYRLGDIEARNLTPRQSQTLLHIAHDRTAAETAEAMECTKANITQLTQALHWKMNTHRQGGLITAAFRNGFLRVICLLLASFIGTGATPEAEASDTDEQQLRFRNKPRRSQGRRVSRRNREWLWDDQNSELLSDDRA